MIVHKTIIRYCDKHGETEFDEYLEKNNRIRRRCKKCRTEAVTKRRKKLKKLAVEYKGGKCSICGYNKCIEALQFHHLDPNVKDFGLSSHGLTRSWKKIKDELDKCVLVCSNCHAELHYN